MKLIMENWRRAIKENSDWDATDIVGALAPDFGYTLETAPKWMVAIAESRPFIVIKSVVDEDGVLFDEDLSVHGVESEYEHYSRKFINLTKKVTNRFVKTSMEELEINIKPKLVLLPLTKTIIERLPKEIGDLYDQTIGAYVLPIKMIDVIIGAVDDLIEISKYTGDFIDFIDEEWPAAAARFDDISHAMYYADPQERDDLRDFLTWQGESLREIYHDIRAELDSAAVRYSNS